MDDSIGNGRAPDQPPEPASPVEPADDIDEMDEFVEDEEEDARTAEIAAFEVATAQLQERCRDADIPANLDTTLGPTLVIEMPAGRSRRRLYVTDSGQAAALLSIDFEKFVFLGDYEAICSYKDNMIEAAISSIRPGPGSFIRQRLFGSDIRARDSQSIEPLEWGLQQDEREIILSIGAESREFAVLVRRRVVRPRLTFRIGGIPISQHDRALNLLTKLADATFFPIELRTDLPLTLERTRRGVRRPGRPPGRRAAGSLSFPKYEYEQEPLALYWYGTSATGMPLLQFLAFYQVIEFYFPTYSETEIRKRIRAILRDPSFDPEQDADLRRLLASIDVHGRRGYGDERAQLRATIHETVDPVDLRSFLRSDDEAAAFFQERISRLTTHKIPLQDQSADLRDAVADRIYDIRCKIVHTKADGNDPRTEMLLPFSREADMLHYDTDLLKYVARRVLIASGRPLII